jgi:hypothetical protein
MKEYLVQFLFELDHISVREFDGIVHKLDKASPTAGLMLRRLFPV